MSLAFDQSSHLHVTFVCETLPILQVSHDKTLVTAMLHLVLDSEQKQLIDIVTHLQKDFSEGDEV